MRRPWAAPFVPLYGAGVGWKNRLYEAGLLKTHALRWPVISVGSLSAGGAGKTPVVKMLAGLLEREGVRVDVLSRGYGRAAGAVEEVEASGSAERFGDEPLEMVGAGLRVFVGADRVAAGELAEGRKPTSQKRDVGNPDFAEEEPRSQNRDLGHPGGAKGNEPTSQKRDVGHPDLVEEEPRSQNRDLGHPGGAKGNEPTSQKRDVGNPDFAEEEPRSQNRDLGHPGGAKGNEPTSQKREVGHPDLVEEEPRSQNRDLGHPGGAKGNEPTSQKRDVGHPDLAEEEPTSQKREVGHPGSGLRVHVLDDGFQHRRLARGLDVVLLTAGDAEDWVLPGGNLREPLRSLGRAGVVVVRAEELERLRPLVARYTQAEVWVIRRELRLPERRLRRPVVFCGIARPEGFLRMLEQAGCAAAGPVVFRDHQRYGQAEVERVLAVARAMEADGFYTTAKDAVKLTPEWRRRLEEVGPLEVVGLSVSLEDERRAIETMLRAVREAGERMRD